MDAYCASEPVLVEKARIRAVAEQQRKAENAAFEARLGQPASFQEHEFTYALLNALFFKHKGAGGATMDIGGLQVHKEVTPYVSNSGRSRDFRVEFAWTSAAGESRRLSKPSAFERNRRNDERRNWGLPE